MKILQKVKDELFYCFKEIANPLYILIIASLLLVGISLGYHSWLDLVLNCFSGPMGIDDNLLILLQWMSHQTLILFLIGNYFNNELNERYIYVILRQRSKIRWILSKIGHVFMLIFIYYLVIFVSIGVMGHILSPNTNGSFMEELLLHTGYSDVPTYLILLNIFMLIITVTFILAIFQIIITLLSRNSILSATIIEFLILISISVSSIDVKLNKYFLVNQAIFSKHNISCFNFSYSYYYLLPTMILSILISTICVKKMKN